MKLNRFDWYKIGALAVIFLVGVISGVYILSPKPQLPIINPADINPALVDDSLERTGRNHKIGDFSLLNQDSVLTTQADLEGKVYVADFFFASCQTICIDMAKNMRMLQEAFKNDEEFMLVSHTVYPEKEDVSVMREYADKQNAIEGKWIFLTGDKKQIYDLARKHYFAVMEPGATFNEHDFIHTDNFILVDTQKRIRGIYVGTDDFEMKKLKGDIRILLKEERNNKMKFDSES